MKTYTAILLLLSFLLPLHAQQPPPIPAISTNNFPPPSDQPGPDAPIVEGESEPIPYPQTTIEQEKEKADPAKPTPKPKPKTPPKKWGDCTGTVYIGQRIVTEKHAGWGWLKTEGGDWFNAKWVMIEEEPGVRMVPGRFHSHPNADHNMQYKLYGTFADYEGYEPNIDAFVDVFQIKGFEIIGKGEEIRRSLPKSQGRGESRISERGANTKFRERR